MPQLILIGTKSEVKLGVPRDQQGCSPQLCGDRSRFHAWVRMYTANDLASHITPGAGIDLMRSYGWPQPDVRIINSFQVFRGDLRLFVMLKNLSAIKIETSRALIWPGP